MPDDAQPNEGQGASPFDSYLESVPQEARGAAEQWFADTSKGLNQKLEAAAETQKRWEPYAQLETQGVQLPPPDQLSELLQWSNQTLQSQETFDQWVTSLAEEKGLTRPEAEAEAYAQQDEGITQDQIQQLVDQRLMEPLQALEARQEEMEHARGVDVETDAIKTELGRLEREGKLDLTERQREAVIELGMPFSKDAQGNELAIGDTSWLKQGFDRFKEIGTEANRAFVEDASARPASAVTAGSHAAAKPITTWDEAKEAARERFRQELSAR